MGETGPRVLMLAPMRSELRPLVRLMGGRPDRLGGVAVHVGRAGRATITAAMIGVGPAAARSATEKLLDAGPFDHVVVSGIAGGVGDSAPVGELVTPAEVEDLSSGRRFTPTTLGYHPPAGVLSTTAELIVDPAAVAALLDRGVVALDMETAAVAEVSEQRGRPWSVFRVISDRPEDGLLDQGVFELLERDGTVNVARTLRYVLAKPARLRPLARLGRDAAGAARKAARAAVSASATL